MTRARGGVHALAWGLLLVLPDRAVRAQEADKLPGWSWTASLFAEETWDSNVSFSRDIADQARPSSFITRPSGTLAYERTGTHSQFALAFRGGGFVYHAQPDLNQFDGGATVAGTFQTTPRLQLDLREAFTYAYTRSQPDLLAEGVLIPLTLARVNDARFGLNYRLGPRVFLSTSVGHTLLQYVDSVRDDETRLVARGGLNWQPRPKQVLTLAYTFQDAGLSQDRPEGLVHSARSSWSFPVGRLPVATLSAGADYSPSSTTGLGGWSPAGSARLAGRFRRSEIGIEYSRFVGRSFGVAARAENDLVLVDYRVEMGRRLRAATAASYRRTRPRGDSRELSAYSFSSTLERTLGRRIRARIGYLLQAESGGERGRIRSHQAQVALGDVWTWR
jgi:hypothetical protein